MAQFRKKPVVIEAVQMTTKMRNDFGPFPEWVLPYLVAEVTEKISNSERIFIRTLEGDMEINDNDWIIRGVKGECYPCKPDIFPMLYEPV